MQITVYISVLIKCKSRAHFKYCENCRDIWLPALLDTPGSGHGDSLSYEEAGPRDPAGERQR